MDAQQCLKQHINLGKQDATSFKMVKPLNSNSLKIFTLDQNELLVGSRA